MRKPLARYSAFNTFEAKMVGKCIYRFLPDRQKSSCGAPLELPLKKALLKKRPNCRLSPTIDPSFPATVSRKNSSNSLNLLVSTLSLTLLLSAGCSSARKVKEQEYPPLYPAGTSDKDLTAIELRLQILEAKLKSLNDKVDAAQTHLTDMKTGLKSETVGVLPHPAEGAGEPVQIFGSMLGKADSKELTKDHLEDPDAGFVHDEVTLDFRKSMILFHAKKYPEAILAFSDFITRNPDHPFAGSAQYYIGQSYLLQKEYRLAVQEYMRLLNSYPHSPHASDGLKSIAQAQEALKDSTSAARNRQLLGAVFPQSPAAASLGDSAPSPTSSSLESNNPETLEDLERESFSEVEKQSETGAQASPRKERTSTAQLVAPSQNLPASESARSSHEPQITAPSPQQAPIEATMKSQGIPQQKSLDEARKDDKTPQLGSPPPLAHEWDASPLDLASPSKQKASPATSKNGPLAHQPSQKEKHTR